MIRALGVDTMRQLLRGRRALTLLGVFVLCGLFVRATRATGSDHLHGAELRGAAIDTWLSSAYLILLVHAVVAALVLSAEDRATGFLTHVGVRPVRRVVYVTGRLVGLVGALALSLAALVAATGPLTGIDRHDVPEMRYPIEAVAWSVNDESLGAEDLAQIGVGDRARFDFDSGGRPDATLTLRPKLVPGRPWSGSVDLQFHYVDADGTRRTWHPDPIRPMHPVPLRFDEDPAGPFSLEVEVVDGGCLLEIDRESMRGVGPRSSIVWQGMIAFSMILCGAAVAGSVAFLFGSGMSLGPAGLAASFGLMIGLGRDTVLDIVAGIGVEPRLGPDQELSLIARWTRGFLTALVRLFPDLGRFNPSEALGEGEAIGMVAMAHAAGYALVVVALTLMLTSLITQWRED